MVVTKAIRTYRTYLNMIEMRDPIGLMLEKLRK